MAEKPPFRKLLMRYVNPMERKVMIAPSVLSANFAAMGEEIFAVEHGGADMIHLDVMDGVFVPNITFGIKMVSDVRKVTDLPLDCHLMIVEPQKYVERFAEAGADYITVHYEACGEKLSEVLSLIKATGKKAGFAFNPDTPAEKVLKYLDKCDLALAMSVFPGFGGQKYIAETSEKCAIIRKTIDENGYDCLLEIDGGINRITASDTIKSGCDVLVAGSAVFSAEDYGAAIRALRS